MKAFVVAGVIGLASACLTVAVHSGVVPLIELKPGNLFTPAKAMEKGSPGSTGARKHIGQPKYEDLKKTNKPGTGPASGSSPTRLQK